MVRQINIIVYPVKDIASAKTFYTTFLGVEPYVDSPYYVGFKLDDLEIGLDPRGQAVTSYLEVDDIKTSLQILVEAGAVIDQEPTNVGGGLLIAKVKDTDGNLLGLRQAPK